MDSPSEEEKKLDQQNQEESSTSISDNEETNNEDSSGPKSEKSEKEPSTFDVVMDSIKPKGEDDDEDDESSEDDNSDEGDEESKDKSEDEDDESDEPSDEELKRWKPKTRKRFENLQAKYRDVNDQLEKAQVEAGHYKQFTEFLESNRITGDEANELFNIGALMKNDPQEALKLIAPHYQRLLQVTGNVLPPDLEQQVSQGYITKQHALELSRHRMSGQTSQAIEQERRQHQQQQDVRQQQQNTASMQSALANWEKQWSTSDPDYSSKKDRVLERVELKLARASREGRLPRTVEQAVQLAEQAKKEVETDFRQRQPKKAVNTVSGGSSNSSLPEPTNTSDVIRRALNK